MLYQLSLEDVQFQQYVNDQPGRAAFIDECGGFGFEFEKEGTSDYYILTAIVVENTKLQILHDQFQEVKKSNGLANTELKSSRVDDKRRSRIMSQLMPLEFRIVLFIADKKQFYKDTPLADYKTVFIKNMDQHLYNLLYQAYPKLSILQDQTGYPEFQGTFKKYVEANRPEQNLFDKYEFDFVDSKDEVLVQLADFIGGSIYKSLVNTEYYNYLEMLKGKITATEFFPNQHEPYWGRLKPENCKYDKLIYTLAVKRARNYISKNEKDESDDKKMQVALLRYLLFYVSQVDPTRYVYSDELVLHLAEIIERRVTKEILFRRVIAPLRDEGVILASSVKGYKIPISVEDIISYLNQTTSTVGPMLHRMGMCRDSIMQGTDNNLDLFDDPAFLKYKKYFDEV